MAEASRTTGPPALGIVVPCFNEQAVLPETARRLLALIERLVAGGRAAAASRVVFVDDGSRDGTWALIESLAAQDGRCTGIKLSRNRGHQNALLAGLLTAPGDVLVSIDADLQDDVEAIAEMLQRHAGGADIVYGVRSDRGTDSAFKRGSADAFYRLMHALGAETVAHHADYRLMSRRAVEALRQYPEVNLFLRGIVPTLGFRSEVVHYVRAPRLAGESKYPLARMLALALDAVTSFSTVPLRLITLAGFTIFAGSMAVTLWALWVRFFTADAVPGWTSIVLPMYFLGGVQILCIGVLGEYLGKAYAETKRRPRFFIDKTVGVGRLSD